MKRRPETVKKDNFHDLVMFGDLSHLPLDHFTSLMETVNQLLYNITLSVVLHVYLCSIAVGASDSQSKQPGELASSGIQGPDEAHWWL